MSDFGICRSLLTSTYSELGCRYWTFSSRLRREQHYLYVLLFCACAFLNQKIEFWFGIRVPDHHVVFPLILEFSHLIICSFRVAIWLSDFESQSLIWTQHLLEFPSGWEGITWLFYNWLGPKFLSNQTLLFHSFLTWNFIWIAKENSIN